MLKSGVTEGIHTPFDDTRLGRFSHIMGKVYSSAGISFTSVDAKRAVPVIQDGAVVILAFTRAPASIDG